MAPNLMDGVQSSLQYLYSWFLEQSPNPNSEQCSFPASISTNNLATQVANDPRFDYETLEEFDPETAVESNWEQLSPEKQFAMKKEAALDFIDKSNIDKKQYSEEEEEWAGDGVVTQGEASSYTAFLTFKTRYRDLKLDQIFYEKTAQYFFCTSDMHKGVVRRFDTKKLVKVDGDTFKSVDPTTNKTENSMRFLGVNTPESKPGTPTFRMDIVGKQDFVLHKNEEGGFVYYAKSSKPRPAKIIVENGEKMFIFGEGKFKHVYPLSEIKMTDDKMIVTVHPQDGIVDKLKADYKFADEHDETVIALAALKWAYMGYIAEKRTEMWVETLKKTEGEELHGFPTYRLDDEDRCSVWEPIDVYKRALIEPACNNEKTVLATLAQTEKDSTKDFDKGLVLGWTAANMLGFKYSKENDIVTFSKGDLKFTRDELVDYLLAPKKVDAFFADIKDKVNKEKYEDLYQDLHPDQYEKQELLGIDESCLKLVPQDKKTHWSYIQTAIGDAHVDMDYPDSLTVELEKIEEEAKKRKIGFWKSVIFRYMEPERKTPACPVN